jgi:hypothetical protein
MATSRLTRTLRCASRRAPVERLTVSIAGRSCGVIPTAMDSANKRESSASRPIATCFGDDPPAASVLDDRAHERAGGQRHRGLRRLDRLDLLLRRRSLARQHRLVALEVICPQQPQIGWYHIADAELDHVSRDQRGHVDSGGLAVAHYKRGVPGAGSGAPPRRVRSGIR